MSYQRQLRNNGEYVSLGGVSYRIDGVEGLGGSSIVYRASYADGLNTEHSHQVYIKELFPWHPKGYVYRDKDGFVTGIKDGAELIEFSKKRFRQGNQINLALLKEMPSQVSGNINSFEAYGTYYSVLALHGGENLESFLERKNGDLSLREIAVIMKRIISALECFHKKSLLHLDISPDNILLTEKQVLLIDYNSVWNTKDEDVQTFSFSEKAGYTAPEISLRNFSEISFATDIYSICAVFFKMVTGQSLNETDIYGNGIARRLSEEIPVLDREAKSARYKTCQILTKGLHVISRKRYQNLRELDRDVSELIDRIDKKGISKAALWESSNVMFKKQAVSLNFLPRKLMVENGDIITVKELNEKLENRGRVLLKGTGGLGKTFILYKLWSDGIKRYHPKAPVYYYVSLKEYNGFSGKNGFIKNSLLKNLSLTKKTENIDEAFFELEKLMDGKAKGGTSQENEKADLVLLLDGLSEAGNKKDDLLVEIDEISRKSSVGIIVTDRTNDVAEYALHSFDIAQLLPLDEETVSFELNKMGLEIPMNKSLRDLLQNPMMLKLYKEILSSDSNKNDTLQEVVKVKDVEGLVCIYLNKMYLDQIKKEQGSRSMQLCHRYIFYHLLPDIAREMNKKKRTFLKLEEMYEVTEKNYKKLHSKSFGKAFPEYLGKTRLMLSKINNVDEWFDFAVNEQLAGKLGLVEKNSSDRYELVHESFLGYLNSVSEKNWEVYAGKLKKAAGAKIAMFVLGCSLIAAAAGGMIAATSSFHDREENPQQETYSDEYETTVKRALVTLQYDLGVLSNQISRQLDVLDYFSMQEALNSVPGQNDYLAGYVENTCGALDAMAISSLKPEVIDRLIELAPDTEIEYLKDLCNKPVEMKEKLDICLDRLAYIFCDEESPYTSAIDRMQIIEIYEDYLDCYSKYCFFQLDYFLLTIAPDQVYDFLNDSLYSEMFRDYFATVKIGEQNKDEVMIAMKYALEDLRDAEKKMAEKGFDI